MKRTALSLILLCLFSAFCRVIYAENRNPVRLAHESIVVGNIDPNEYYQPALVVFDPNTKRVDLLNNRGEQTEYRGVIQSGEIIIYTNKGLVYMRCPIDEKMTLHGTAKYFSIEGKVYSTAEFKDGSRDGATKYYFMEGKLKSIGAYRKGVLHGPVISYYPSGKIHSQGQYKNGLEDGLNRQYNPAGELSSERYYDNGIPQTEMIFVNGKPQVREYRNSRGFDFDFYDILKGFFAMIVAVCKIPCKVPMVDSW